MSIKGNRIRLSKEMLNQFLVIASVLLLSLFLAACQVALPDPALTEPAAKSESAPASSADEPVVSTANVHLFPATGDNDVEGAMSTLERTADGIMLEIETVDLTPGEAYTLWWVIFNKPEACSDGQCMGPDLSAPATVSMVGYAAGAIADEDGRVNFTVNLTAGDTAGALDNSSGFPFELIEPAPGLLDPLTAEVHGVIRTHGMALEDPNVQLSTFSGDCNPECVKGASPKL